MHTLNPLARAHLDRVTRHDYKISSEGGWENHFFLKNCGLQIHIYLNTTKTEIEINVEEILFQVSSSYKFRKPITVPEYVLAYRDALKNFHTDLSNNKKSTWMKYRNPSKEKTK